MRRRPPGSRHGLTRRETLTLLMSGAAACTAYPRGQAVPWVSEPPESVPGRSRAYATTLDEEGYGIGVLLETREGRPTRIDGNPLHPGSLGSVGAREQARIQGLYDPNRGRLVRQGDQPRAPQHFDRALAQLPADGRGVHLLLEPTSSPVHADLLLRLAEVRPALRVHHFSPLATPGPLQGARLAWGRDLEALPRAHELRRLLCIGADPLSAGPARLVFQRGFAATRRDPEDLCRVYVAESSTSLMGARADHRLPVRPSRLPAVLLAAAARITPTPPLPALRDRFEPSPSERLFAETAADALLMLRGSAAVLVGERMPAWAHALAAMLNHRLGAPIDLYPTPRILDGTGLPALFGALDAGVVDTLIVLGGNPAYTIPSELRPVERLRRARRLLRLGAYEDETSALADWYCPERHPFETWGDARWLDGTVGLQQPLIRPLFDGRSATEVLALLAGLPSDPRALVEARYGPALQDALRQGTLQGSAILPERVPPDEARVLEALLGVRPPPDVPFELEIVPSPHLLDGRHANLPWLQELPHPITRQTWGNAAMVGPRMAEALRVSDGDHLRLRADGAEIELPVAIVPGQDERTVTVELGYGRSGEEVVAAGIGVDVSRLRDPRDPWLTPDVRIARTDGHTPLARTQKVFDRQGRAVARRLTADGAATLAGVGEPVSLWKRDHRAPTRLSAPNQWGMVIDLAACTGCQACVIACQAENNVPVVGASEVHKGRQMHWLRIDRYEDPGIPSPGHTFQPMLCQHCELAPCEYVCPVHATVHSPDGLNEMVYNRCVGTRFCSNNCPYKVRRFNWFDYHADTPALRALQFNPSVTVRQRGVIEKCTFCVQRIRSAGIRATREGRAIRTGEVVTACQAVCPSEAIVFGDLADPDDPVGALSTDPRAWAELGELGTRPRVRYLADLHHPDPMLLNGLQEGVLAASEPSGEGQ